MAVEEQAFWLEELGRSRRYTQWLLSRVLPFVDGSVLEIGCGTGTITRHLALASDRVHAVDLDAGFVDQARRAMSGLPNVTVEQADATCRVWRGQFDTVVMLDVLEHIAEDQTMLRTLRGALASGGRIVLKVPAHQALFGEMDKCIGHHRRYSRASLVDVLASSGFEDPKVSHFNMASVFGWWLNGKALRRNTPGSEQIKVFEAVVPLLRAVEERVSPPFGLSLIAIATRP